jgi:hypothetical protein
VGGAQPNNDKPIEISDVLVAATVRWRLRGMDLDLAIRKTRTDECYQRELQETASTLDRLKANPISIEKPILKS